MFCDLPLDFSGLYAYCKACHRLHGSLLAAHAKAARLNASSEAVSCLVAREQWWSAWAKLEFRNSLCNELLMWPCASSLCGVRSLSSSVRLSVVKIPTSVWWRTLPMGGEGRRGRRVLYFKCLSEDRTNLHWGRLLLSSYSMSPDGYLRPIPNLWISVGLWKCLNSALIPLWPRYNLWSLHSCHEGFSLCLVLHDK